MREVHGPDFGDRDRGVGDVEFFSRRTVRVGVLHRAVEGVGGFRAGPVGVGGRGLGSLGGDGEGRDDGVREVLFLRVVAVEFRAAHIEQVAVEEV